MSGSGSNPFELPGENRDAEAIMPTALDESRESGGVGNQRDPGSLEDEQTNDTDTHDGQEFGHSLDPLHSGHPQEGPVLEEPEVEERINAFQMDEVQKTIKLINAIKDTHFGDAHDGLHQDFVDRLHNPLEEPLEEPLVLEDPDLCLSIDIYLSISNASQETYNATRKAILR